MSLATCHAFILLRLLVRIFLQILVASSANVIATLWNRLDDVAESLFAERAAQFIFSFISLDHGFYLFSFLFQKSINAVNLFW